MILVPIKILDHAKDLPLPFYATPSSAGMDLCSAAASDLVLPPVGRILVPTGVCLALPEGYEAQIRSRSGLSYKNGVVVLNAPGTIDADYRGEIFVILSNFSDEDFKITRGMRIAQMVVAKYERATWSLVNELETTQRQDGGFGSTGV